jgi:hypothetical protein
MCENNEGLKYEIIQHERKIFISECNQKNPSRWCLHFEVVGKLEWPKDPESYAGVS